MIFSNQGMLLLGSNDFLKSFILANPSIEPEHFLWEYNCAIYSVVKAWRATHDTESETSKPDWDKTTLDGKIGGKNEPTTKTNLPDLTRRRNETNPKE